eukprot:CAMPEP_0113711012 /NCGR_PEP_ID=MMETSP0038_2-20120614/30497_1 /TAXON_ID=2898 /ORGANISM="Cryptomonas paramecium" /LENGTH=119 /DNA_ID=CAMNT_0000637175 /DNA_START=77 /DNA_END=433 /DNA_ORIENTATION=- /assembly_acc=CAM_ASM_000170
MTVQGNNDAACKADDVNVAGAAASTASPNIVVSIKGPERSYTLDANASTTVADLVRDFANASEHAFDDERARFMYGGRILKSTETLQEIMRYSSDKSTLLIRLLLPPTITSSPASTSSA